MQERFLHGYKILGGFSMTEGEKRVHYTRISNGKEEKVVLTEPFRKGMIVLGNDPKKVDVVEESFQKDEEFTVKLEVEETKVEVTEEGVVVEAKEITVEEPKEEKEAQKKPAKKKAAAKPKEEGEKEVE